MTNADRVREMSDVELAKVLCCQNNKTGYECESETSCERCTLEWLQQESEVNVYDEEEIHDNCTVQILKNSATGEISVGWWENE